jgi:DNA primase
LPIPPDFLEELRRRLTLSSVVAKRVRLTKKGREFEGLCPFHNEKTPSFFVNDDKAFYHCFGCGAHGDVLSFVINTEGLSFPEAVERLAGEAGLEVPRTARGGPQSIPRHQILYDALETACRWFEEQLHSSIGREAMIYLAKRGVDQSSISRFRLGFAPNSNSVLKKWMLGKDYAEADLVDAGLLRRRSESNETYDLFRARVIFPICDARGKVVGFGGRLLGEGDVKYLNTPETELFQKRKILYGFHLARAAAHKTKEAIVVEGYMDAVALHAAGFAQTVASLGTAFTSEQLGLMWQLAPEPFVCFDGDAAGKRAAAKVVGLALPFVAPEKSLRFVTLPEGEDPDDIVRMPNGRDRLGDLLAAATPLATKLWETEFEASPPTTPERQAGFEQRILDAINSIDHQRIRTIYRQQFEDKVRDNFGRSYIFKGNIRRVNIFRNNYAQKWKDKIPYHQRTDLPGFISEDSIKTFKTVDLDRLGAEQVIARCIALPQIVPEIEEELLRTDLISTDLEALKFDLVRALGQIEQPSSEELENALASPWGSLLHLLKRKMRRGGIMYLGKDPEPEKAKEICLEYLKSFQEKNARTELMEWFSVYESDQNLDANLRQHWDRQRAIYESLASVH